MPNVEQDAALPSPPHLRSELTVLGKDAPLVTMIRVGDQVAGPHEFEHIPQRYTHAAGPAYVNHQWFAQLPRHFQGRTKGLGGQTLAHPIRAQLDTHYAIGAPHSNRQLFVDEPGILQLAYLVADHAKIGDVEEGVEAGLSSIHDVAL